MEINSISVNAYTQQTSFKSGKAKNHDVDSSKDAKLRTSDDAMVEQTVDDGAVYEKTADTSVYDQAADSGVVYEKSEDTQSTVQTYSKNTKVDNTATIEQLKADAEARTSQLASLVEKLMTKQGQTSNIASLSDLMKGVVNGDIEVDEETVEQAKKDVAEGGYWSVDETAERIVSFAKALTGGDTSKIEEMRSAIEKGFSAAQEDWGDDDLPEITQNTYDKVNELLDEWAKETEEQ